MSTATANRRLFVHAGMHKTGTSAFQNVLRRAAERQGSADAVFVAPEALNPKRESFSRSWIHNTTRLAQLHHGQAVISWELISSLNATQLAKIRASLYFEQEPVLVYVFRHWNTAILSRWAQNSMRRDSRSFHDYVQRLLTGKQRFDFWFDLVLREAREAGFSSFRCLGYEACQRRFGSIVPPLAAATGVSHWLGPADEKVYSNQRADLLAIELTRLFNGALETLLDRQADGLIENMVRHQAHDGIFNCFPVVQGLCEAKHPLIDALITCIENTRAPLPQDGRDLIVAAKTRLEAACQPFLFMGEAGPNDNRNMGSEAEQVTGTDHGRSLFPADLDDSLNIGPAASTLNYGDLPLTIRQRINDCILLSEQFSNLRQRLAMSS